MRPNARNNPCTVFSENQSSSSDGTMTMVSTGSESAAFLSSLEFVGFPDVVDVQGEKLHGGTGLVMCGTGFEPADPYGTAS